MKTDYNKLFLQGIKQLVLTIVIEYDCNRNQDEFEIEKKVEEILKNEFGEDKVFIEW